MDDESGEANKRKIYFGKRQPGEEEVSEEEKRKIYFGKRADSQELALADHLVASPAEESKSR